MSEQPIILFVDDEKANRFLFETTFKSRHNLRVVESGPEALELLAQETVALVLADQRMPGMTGMELLEQVKTEYPDVVRVMVTAYDDIQTILDAVNKAEVARYVLKPWVVAELDEVIEWSLGEFARARRARELLERADAMGA